MHFVYKIAHRLSFVVFYTLYQIDVANLEYLPSEGPYILAINHVSYFDPPALACCLPQATHFFARKTLFKPGFAAWLLSSLNTIPVDRDGESDPGAIKKVLKLLKTGKTVVLFPEGTRSLNGKLQTAKRGVGLLACKTQVPVVPIYISGAYNALKRGESLPTAHAPLWVTFGKPLHPKDYDLGPDCPNRFQAAADSILKAIAAIPVPVA
jgi:1-acyl-sn-glycerol-3-phosphate acyltransferase